MSPDKHGYSLVGAGVHILIVPLQFIIGFIVGLAAPIAAIGAMVAGIRLLTGKVPFLGHSDEDAQGGRRLSFTLVPPDEVGNLFAEQKDVIGKDLMALQTEIRAIMEEAKISTQGRGQDEIEVPLVAANA